MKIEVDVSFPFSIILTKTFELAHINVKLAKSLLRFEVGILSEIFFLFITVISEGTNFISNSVSVLPHNLSASCLPARYAVYLWLVMVMKNLINRITDWLILIEKSCLA